MKTLLFAISLLLLPLMLTGQKLTLVQQDSVFVRENFTKQEVYITMRDGIRLFTSIYIPKDISSENPYPFLIHRTCFGSSPYGPTNYPKLLYYSNHVMREKFIFIKQDVRGRYMSEGIFTNMRPFVPSKKTSKDVDESSDAYDTIEWLLKNIPNNNGNVGLYGISYTGFYAMCGALSGHSAIKAVSPQAPISDFFFEDFHHNGAFVLAVGNALPVFGIHAPKPTESHWFLAHFPEIKTENCFNWYKSMTPLQNFGKLYSSNFFWNEIIEHPNYDDFWQKRSIIPHLNTDTKMPPILNVGGWFDAEDMVGVLDIYKQLEKNNSSVSNTLIMGPFGHGDWSREQGHYMQGNIYFGDSLATFFQKNIELVFYKKHLKNVIDKGAIFPKAYLFDTGKKEWTNFATYPVKDGVRLDLYLHADKKLSAVHPKKGFQEYLSDPKNPVPYAEGVFKTLDFLPNYMSDDQRFVTHRKDVLTFQTEDLREDITLIGEIKVSLKFSTSGTDTDFFVKVIDGYPQNEPNSPYTPVGIKLAGYQQMVRSEIMRAKFRNSFSNPESLVPNQKTNLDFRLQDVYHTFKKGHSIMIQIQSSAFPLFDINPQKFVNNIYKANERDFQKAAIKIFSESKISVNMLSNTTNGK